MKIATPETIQLWGGTLALELANSVDRDEHGAHVTPTATDVLRTADALERWGARLGVRISPGASAWELEAVRDLRESVYRVFEAVARDAEPPQPDLDAIRATYAMATAAGELAPDNGVWRLSWPDYDPRRVRFAAAADAIRLLGDHDRLARVTRCPGRNCGWLFLNTSGRRRWCSMSACGSREKMRRMSARRAAERQRTLGRAS
jgi:predicted RNA-binding Zn ribbon-like protein